MFEKNEIKTIIKEATLGIKEALTDSPQPLLQQNNVKKEISNVAEYLSSEFKKSSEILNAEIKDIRSMQYIQLGTVGLAVLLGGTLYVKNQAEKSYANMNRVLPAHSWDSNEDWVDW